MKRIILLCIHTCLCLVIQAQTFTIDNVNYEIIPESNFEVRIIKSKPTGDIEIPKTVKYMNQNYTVATIEESAFSRSIITSIILPNTITNIGSLAFGGCMHLNTIILPNSVKHVGWAAFEQTAITSIIYPNSINHIEDHSFRYCRNLTSIIIPDTLTHIGVEAFMDCRNLTSITLPNSLIYIKEGAFASSGLKTINIPKSVTHIGSLAFAIRNLSSVTVYAKTPPLIESNTFTNFSIPVFVPEASLQLYKEHMYWGKFSNITAIDNDE